MLVRQTEECPPTLKRKSLPAIGVVLPALSPWLGSSRPDHSFGDFSLNQLMFFLAGQTNLTEVLQVIPYLQTGALFTYSYIHKQTQNDVFYGFYYETAEGGRPSKNSKLPGLNIWGKRQSVALQHHLSPHMP